MVGYRGVLDLIERTHTEDSPLAAHMKGLQTIVVDFVHRPGLRGVINVRQKCSIDVDVRADER